MSTSDPPQGRHRPSPLPSSSQTEEQSSDVENEESAVGEEREWEEDLCQAIVDDDWPKVIQIMDTNCHDASDKIHCKGKPALLLAAQYGSITIVKELLKVLPPDSISAKDYEGWTALAFACYYNGNTQIAELLVARNSDLPTIGDEKGFLPIAWALSNNFIEMARYLYKLTRLEDRDVSGLIINCLKVPCLDIALELLQKRQHLLVHILTIIATLNTRIRSRSELSFWERCIYNLINIPSITPTKHVSVDIQEEFSGRHDQATMNEPGHHDLRQRFINSITNFEGVKKIQELKLLHQQVDDLYLLVRNNARKEFASKGISEALCLAAEEGNVDFVLQVSKGIPEPYLQQLMSGCFFKAVEHRQAKVFNLIHGYLYRPPLKHTVDSTGGSLLHKVAMKAPDHILSRIYAPTLQIQRELQWFKEVEFFMLPRHMGDQNKNGLTPIELFRKEHKDLMEKGEQWIKDTASSCSVVGTLIMTIMFAAAYTVPGGNDQTYGYPLFIKQPLFMVFIFSTILSLLFSSASVLSFLAILTSQYSEEKFLEYLPRTLIFGIVFLFLSIVCMITAFLSTTYLMLKHTQYVWGLLPILILASVPIFLFVRSELPLLYHTYISTYRKIFDRNVKPWP